MDTVREDRFSRRRECERVRRASETPEERERRLSARRQRDRARRAATRFMITIPNYTCSSCSPRNALHFQYRYCL